MAVGGTAAGPLVGKPERFEGDIAYFRVGRVGAELPGLDRDGFQELNSTNAVKGVVLDLPLF